MYRPLGSVLALVLALTGCHRLDRAGECRALSGAVNPVLRAIDSQRKKDPEGVGTYRAISMQYASLSAKLDPRKVETKPLGEALGEYQKLLADASRDAGAFADALESKDRVRIAQVRGNAGRTTKREPPLVARIAGMCRGR